MTIGMSCSRKSADRDAGDRQASVPPRKRKSVKRFKVYRPEPTPNKPTPDDGPKPKRRFTVHDPKTRETPTPVESRASRRFNVYVPSPPNVERYKPNGAAWIECDGYWMCEYGCKTFRTKEAPNGVASDDYHAYDCPYWWEQGIHETPF